MQYTGLKDKNGKEIYERDILPITLMDHNGDEDTSNVQIYYSESEAMFVCKGPGIEFDLDWVHGSEVIGNIYENPELL